MFYYIFSGGNAARKNISNQLQICLFILIFALVEIEIKSLEQVAECCSGSIAGPRRYAVCVGILSYGLLFLGSCARHGSCASVELSGITRYALLFSFLILDRKSVV